MPFLPSFFLRLILFFCFFPIFLSTVWGYDFRSVRKSLLTTFVSREIKPKNVRLVLIFETPQREQLKKEVNLVRLKKEFAYEMLRSFQVADPVVIGEMLRRNKITPQQLKQNASLVSEFLDQAESSHLLFVKILKKEEDVLILVELMNRYAQVLMTKRDQLSLQEKSSSPTRTEETESPESQVDSPVHESIMANFEPVPFDDTHNNAWMRFTPTAMLIPEEMAIEGSLWMQNPSNNDFFMKSLRFDYRLKLVQLGVQAYGTETGGLHSSYAMLKFQVINERIFPFFLSLGARYRLFWNQDNEELKNDDQEIEEDNERRNRATFLLALGGKVHGLGLLYHFYLDNQSTSLGAKFSLTDQIKLFAEVLYNYYNDAPVVLNGTGGIELVTSQYTLLLHYQTYLEQFILGMGFNF